MAFGNWITADSLMAFQIDLAFLLSDSSNQVNGCNHDSGYTSSDEGDSSEEVDDSHCYAEFVKRNHVQLSSLCLYFAYGHVCEGAEVTKF